MIESNVISEEPYIPAPFEDWFENYRLSDEYKRERRQRIPRAIMKFFRLAVACLLVYAEYKLLIYNLKFIFESHATWTIIC